MYIFLLSIIIVSFISYCFFKNKFWENRYLILGMIGGVALVATLTTNYIVRRHLKTEAVIVWKIPIKLFYASDSLFTDSSSLIKNTKFDFDKQYANNFLKKDTTHHKRTIAIVLYDKLKSRKIGYIKSNHKTTYVYFNEYYIAPSISDSIAYIIKKNLKYVVKGINWIRESGFPAKSSYTCIYIPPKQYALLPDSIIRKLPF